MHPTFCNGTVGVDWMDGMPTLLFLPGLDSQCRKKDLEFSPVGSFGQDSG